MTEIARLIIVLDEVEPSVTRQVEVPKSMRLDDLHLVFQIALGWENHHLYEFRVGRVAWGIPDPDGDFMGPGPRPAAEATLADLMAVGAGKRFSYLYDFGDGWQHSVEVEAITEARADIAYPRLVAAEGRCPPEDVGGPVGYAEYLAAVADPSHEDHADMIEWRGSGFDPTVVDEAAIRKGLAKLAKGLERRLKKVGSKKPAQQPHKPAKRR